MKLYGVFVGRKWAMTRNKRQALAYARKTNGIVRVMPYPYDTHVWDAPTFTVCSDVLADFSA